MALQARPERFALLPDPVPREVRYTVISVDDHLVEPAEMFVARVPGRFAERVPRVRRDDRGSETWVYEDTIYSQLGLNAVVGHERRDDFTQEPARFSEMRPGCYQIKDRIADMDLGGIWASVCFPSAISGFCGSVYSRSADPELGYAVMRAWNDWFFEEWYGPFPERIVPMGITWLADPRLGADEVHRNAERGFALSFPEQPHRLGYPSLHSRYWDPVLAACAETGTVVCLHVGSSGGAQLSADAPVPGASGTLFQALALTACVDWLWSGVALRYPGLKIAMSEGGIGWVPMLIDRLEFMMDHSGHGRSQWPSADISPTELLGSAFWFCTIDDPSALELRHRIGIDRIMVESDYPHADSTWPDTQAFLERRLGHLPPDEVRKMTHENAAALFRHPLPAVTLP